MEPSILPQHFFLLSRWETWTGYRIYLDRSSPLHPVLSPPAVVTRDRHLAPCLLPLSVRLQCHSPVQDFLPAAKKIHSSPAAWWLHIRVRITHSSCMLQGHIKCKLFSVILLMHHASCTAYSTHQCPKKLFKQSNQKQWASCIQINSANTLCSYWKSQFTAHYFITSLSLSKNSHNLHNVCGWPSVTFDVCQDNLW